MRRLLITLIAVVSVSACTPAQARIWQDWHSKDPSAALDYARRGCPGTSGCDVDGSTRSGGNGWTAGNCASFSEEAAAAGLPWGIFSPIAWRESGCNPNSWVHDSDDWGGGLFGLNFISQSLRDGWLRLCGATMSNIRGNVPLQMRCAAAAYRTMGLSPWRT